MATLHQHHPDGDHRFCPLLRRECTGIKLQPGPSILATAPLQSRPLGHLSHAQSRTHSGGVDALPVPHQADGVVDCVVCMLADALSAAILVQAQHSGQCARCAHHSVCTDMAGRLCLAGEAGTIDPS